MTEKEVIDYLEIDNPIPGQNYVCVSFVSPETVMKHKEMFLFNKFMNQRCGEYEKKIDDIISKCSDELKEKIETELKEELQKEMRYEYDTFKSKFDDFTYKYHDVLETKFNKISDNQTNVRGVKIRGVFDSYRDAENRAKVLQRTDRSFHVFVGQVGYWLPWDPIADRVQDEEYLEDGLQTIMKGYKENEINRDLFYAEEKRDKLKDAMTKKKQNELKDKGPSDALEDPDPWMQSKFGDSEEVEKQTEEINKNTTENIPNEGNTVKEIKEI